MALGTEIDDRKKLGKKNEKKLGKNRYQPLAERDGARGVATPGVGVCVCGFN